MLYHMTMLDLKNVWPKYMIYNNIPSVSTHRKQIQLCNVEKQTN